jgi:hypothetical protein
MLAGQFEASLCMMNDRIRKCPPQHWDGKIARYAFWHVAYHTLCFVDLYLSPDEASFQFRDIHPQGWHETRPRNGSRWAGNEPLIIGPPPGFTRPGSWGTLPATACPPSGP